jgi:hypothetical protein
MTPAEEAGVLWATVFVCSMMDDVAGAVRGSEGIECASWSSRVLMLM